MSSLKKNEIPLKNRRRNVLETIKFNCYYSIESINLKRIDPRDITFKKNIIIVMIACSDVFVIP